MQHQLLISILFIFVLVILVLYQLQCSSWSQPPIPLTTNSCVKSFRESNGFICESDELWNERKILHRIQDELNLKKIPSSLFFLTNWEPDFHCSHARRIGTMGDGGKWVCDLFQLKTRHNCLVYSAGSNGDFSFEVALKQYLPNCEIHTFDVNLYTCPQNICIFHQLTLGNGTSPIGSKTWEMIIEELGHVNRLIDVFKIDIEGGEFSFFPTIFQSSNPSHPQQILVEVHPLEIVVEGHPPSPETIHTFFELLRKNNYVIFSKEPNIMIGAKLFEYAFLKLNSEFFQ